MMNGERVGEDEAKIEQRVHLCCSESDCCDASEVAKPHPNLSGFLLKAVVNQ